MIIRLKPVEFACLPSLHIELGLMKQFVKALSKGGEYVQFPGLPEAKMKEGENQTLEN